MIKKIQQYLLIHHPLLWNIKIVPVLLAAIIINGLLFCGGYTSTEINFTSTYYYYSGPYFTKGFLYFGAVILSILFLIFWLIAYSKNNAFKVFYPKNARSMYLEWILICICVFSISQFPLSFNRGEIEKIKSYASKDDMMEAIKVLNMVDILIPETKTSYYKEYPDQYNNDIENFKGEYSYSDEAIVADTAVVVAEEAENVEDIVAKAELENKEFEGYPNFRQLSLMNYDGYNHLYIPERYKIKVDDFRTVKTWLVNQDKAKIEELMDSFLKLHEKHGLKTNLTKDQWMKLVYNPKKYPVGDFNQINRFNINRYKENDYYSSYSSEERETPHGYYFQYEELVAGYDMIMDAYMDSQEREALTLISICFALSISLLIFSFRITSGKSWLIAFVSMGLILIIDLLLSLITASNGSDVTGLLLYVIILLLVFICEFIYLLAIRNKGRSNIIMNHLVWFIPTVPVLIFMLVYIISDQTCVKYDKNCIYHFMEDHIIEFIWANVCLTFVTVGLFIRFVLLKWKGLPEE